MNAAHFHLIVNHIPVMGSIFGIVFLLISLLGRNKTLIKASLWILLIVGMLTIPAYYSGEGAEEMIGHQPGISGEIIHEHEESAEKAFIAVIGLSLIAAGGLLLQHFKRRVSGMFLATILVLAIITGVLMAGAANKGGEIRHPEIRPGVEMPHDADRTPEAENHKDNGS
jgi:uncharacterized membrane protein